MTQENQGNQDGQQQDQGQQQGQETQQQNQDQDKDKGNEAKFTQDDLNKFAAKIRAEEKAKADKIQADLKRQQELAAMQETDRLKAEKEDAEKKLQELQKQMEFSKQKTETLSGLAEAKLDSRFIDVLMSDKPNSDKIKLIADIQKEAIDKAIKDAMPAHNPKGQGTDVKGGALDNAKTVKYGFEKFK